MQHLIDIADLSRADIERLCERAASSKLDDVRVEDS